MGRSAGTIGIRLICGAPKLYQKVADSIVASIRKGLYPRGTRSPPERELAEEFGVSRATIREATIALEIRGIAEAKRGSGVYVVDAPVPDIDSSDADIGPFVRCQRSLQQRPRPDC